MGSSRIRKQRYLRRLPNGQGSETEFSLSGTLSVVGLHCRSRHLPHSLFMG